MGAMLAQQLVGAGEHVVDVPPKLSARVRLMDTGRIDKSDLNDARSAAIVALRNATLNTVTGEHEDRVVVRWLTATASSSPSGPGPCAACTPCCVC